MDENTEVGRAGANGHQDIGMGASCLEDWGAEPTSRQERSHDRQDETPDSTTGFV
jgi:hypothetical protein